jgi:heptaprenylglyceryl phosphate synthase
MIQKVRSYIDIPIIVGGGIRDAKTAQDKLSAGADIIVTGNLLREKNGLAIMREIAQVVKNKKA